MVLHPYYYFVTEASELNLIPIMMTQTSMECQSSQKKTECDLDSCSGLMEQTSMSCVLSQVVDNPKRFKEMVRKQPEHTSSCHDGIFCSDICCKHETEQLELEVIEKECSGLAALLKKNHVELAP